MLSISVVPLDKKTTNGFELEDYKTTSNKHTVAIDLNAKNIKYSIFNIPRHQSAKCLTKTRNVKMVRKI